MKHGVTVARAAKQSAAQDLGKEGGECVCQFLEGGNELHQPSSLSVHKYICVFANKIYTRREAP